MSHATIQTSREFGLEDLYPDGCKTDCFTVSHARDILSFMNERISFSLNPLIAYFRLTIASATLWPRKDG